MPRSGGNLQPAQTPTSNVDAAENSGTPKFGRKTCMNYAGKKQGLTLTKDLTQRKDGLRKCLR